MDLIRCSHSIRKNWMKSQLCGKMTMEKHIFFWAIDHCIPLSSLNLLVENEMRKCFCSVNLRPFYCNENNSKNAKNDQRLYLQQEIKAV